MYKVTMLLIILFFSGCTGGSKNIFKNRKDDYLLCSTAKELQFSPNSKHVAKTDRFSIPKVHSTEVVENREALTIPPDYVDNTNK